MRSSNSQLPPTLPGSLRISQQLHLPTWCLNPVPGRACLRLSQSGRGQRSSSTNMTRCARVCCACSFQGLMSASMTVPRSRRCAQKIPDPASYSSTRHSRCHWGGALTAMPPPDIWLPHSTVSSAAVAPSRSCPTGLRRVRERNRSFEPRSTACVLSSHCASTAALMPNTALRLRCASMSSTSCRVRSPAYG